MEGGREKREGGRDSQNADSQKPALTHSWGWAGTQHQSCLRQVGPDQFEILYFTHMGMRGHLGAKMLLIKNQKGGGTVAQGQPCLANRARQT